MVSRSAQKSEKVTRLLGERQLHPLKEGACDMAGPNHIYNLIIGFLGELPLHAERFSLIRNRFRGPVDRGPSTYGYGTWSVVPPTLTGMLLPEVEWFGFSDLATCPETVFSHLRECLAGVYHSHPINRVSLSHLSIASIPPLPEGRGLLEVRR